MKTMVLFLVVLFFIAGCTYGLSKSEAETIAMEWYKQDLINQFESASQNNDGISLEEFKESFTNLKIQSSAQKNMDWYVCIFTEGFKGSGITLKVDQNKETTPYYDSSDIDNIRGIVGDSSFCI
jgi:hypothetical protein